jgi:hypothetical protein
MPELFSSKLSAETVHAFDSLNLYRHYYFDQPGLPAAKQG